MILAGVSDRFTYFPLGDPRYSLALMTGAGFATMHDCVNSNKPALSRPYWIIGGPAADRDRARMRRLSPSRCLVQ